jgi:excisionase family DNA binding protein
MHPTAPQAGETTQRGGWGTSQRTPRIPTVPNPLAGLLAGPQLPAAVRAVDGGRDHLLSVREVAAQLGVSTATIYKLVEKGDLPNVRVANAIRVAPRDLARFIDLRRSGGRP